jgi:hypothetical protein
LLRFRAKGLKMKIMLSPIALIFFLLTSCGTFKSHTFDVHQDIEALLKSLPMTGEGRGRVGMKGQQFVFSYDALLDKRDWIFSATIPLHGEELMIFRNLQDFETQSEAESFERRIEAQFNEEVDAETSGKTLVSEWRQLTRFLLSSSLGLSRVCEKNGLDDLCKIAGEDRTYTVRKFSEKKLLILRDLASGESIALEGENFDNGAFKRMNFSFFRKQEKLFSLELFWK